MATLLEYVFELCMESFVGSLTLEDMWRWVCCDTRMEQQTQAFAWKETLGFVRHMLVRECLSYSVEDWTTLRKECQNAVLAEGWSIHSWDYACWMNWKDGRFILPETFYLVWDTLICNESVDCLSRAQGDLNQYRDEIVGVLAYQINIRYPSKDLGKAYHGAFVTHAMFVLRS